MKLLITGGSGFVGRNLVRFFAERYSVTFTYLNSLPPEDLSKSARKTRLDIRDAHQVAKLVEHIAVDAVIHVAGNKNVRFCEQNPIDAHAVNAVGTRNVARACKVARAQMVYLSTDLVFDCLTGNYRETYTPRPSSVYGASKLAGETEAFAELPDVAICRSGGIYGPESPLLAWLAGELRAGRSVSCLTNVKNTPTYVAHLGEMVDVILRRGHSGIFHAVGSEMVNRYQFFRAFADEFQLDSGLLCAIDSEQMMRDAMLCPNASLDSSHTRAVLRAKSMSVKQGMAAF